MKLLTLDKAKIDAARTKWQPIDFGVSQSNQEFPEFVKRFVALRDLECSVATFIKEVAEESPEVAEVLLRNVRDEDNHKKQLDYLATYIGLNDNENYGDYLDDLDEHPILKVFMLEQVLFMVTLPKLQKVSDFNIANVGSYILLDEVIHVRCCRDIVTQLALKPSKELIKRVFSLVAWVFSDEPVDEQDKVMKTAKLLLKRGFDAVADETTHTVPASVNFFEVDRDSIVY